MLTRLAGGAGSFARFYLRVALAHFLSYVVVGGVSYMLIMRHYLGLVPADTGLREITSSHVQFWIWPAQLVRALVLAAVFFPLRDALTRMGRLGGLMIAGVMVGIGCLGGFSGLFEDLIFYRNVSLYLYYIHIPEIAAQTLCFGYLLMYLESNAQYRTLQQLGLHSDSAMPQRPSAAPLFTRSAVPERRN
jgi:hypothetical protein